MIFVDTNIIIDFWKKPDGEKTGIFNDNEVAIKNNCLLWTNDKHFPMISGAVDGLKLFE
jgi:predicted nucleic acid-binding protein